MKITRKGFTLVELLIVVAVIGALAAMMTMSSTESVDAAGANAIVSNLQSLKVAAYQMYMYEPKIASKTAIAITGADKVDADSSPKDERTIAQVLGSYLGKKSDAIGITTTVEENKDDVVAGKYGLIGDGTNWYVVYRLDDTVDTKGIKAKLKDKANASDLYSATVAIKSLVVASSFTAGYSGGNETCIALKVR